MDLSTIIVCVLSSTVAAALVNSTKDLIIFSRNRQDNIDEKREEKEDKILLLEERMKSTEEKLAKLSESVLAYMEEQNDITKSLIRSEKLIMQGKIEYLATKFIHEGAITLEHRKLIHEMWHEYHYTWNGNGDLNLLMEAVDELPLK